MQGHIGEAAAQQELLAIVQHHLHQHGAGARIELAGNARDLHGDRAAGIGSIHDLGTVAFMDEGSHILLHIGLDAQFGVVGNRDHRLGRGLTGGGVLNQRSGIGEAGGHPAVEGRHQSLIGFEGGILVQGRFGHPGVGIGLIGLLGGDGVLAQQLVIALGDALFVDQVGAGAVVLRVSLLRFDGGQQLARLHRIALIHQHLGKIAAHLGVERGLLVGRHAGQHSDLL